MKHNAGFFSCCSVLLYNIIDFFNTNKILPKNVDSSLSFEWYKNNTQKDITYDYFEHYNNVNTNIIFNKHIDYHYNYQFIDYSKLNFKDICPFIEKYFSLSLEIKNIIKDMEKKYSIDYNNICVLFYRGNDKNTETNICSYDDYLDIANKKIIDNPNIKFLIQSDETQFIDLFTSKFPKNSFYFKDEIRHIKKCNSTVDICMKDTNYMFSKYYLAITYIMSMCKYIVCGSGNCSIWIILYRGNNTNVYQNLNSKWNTY